MYSSEVERVLRILGSSRSHQFSDRAEIVAVQAAADAGLCLHVRRDNHSLHVVKEPYGWSEEGVAVVLTASGRRELEKLYPPPSTPAAKTAVNRR